jgi:HNH endonuclease/NUMOD4 motif
MENWLPVPGYEGLYEASDQGRVRSLDRMVGNCHGSLSRIRGKILSPAPHCRNGYPMVCLNRNGSREPTTVHRIVAAAFLGPRPGGMEVCHNDGDASNNRVENLRYDTRSENIRDTWRHGRRVVVPRTHCANNHALSEDNIYIWRGKANCRPCRTEAERRRRKRARLSAA